MPTYLYFLLWGVFFFLIMRFGCGAHIMGHGHGHRGDAGQPERAPLSDDRIYPLGTERSNEHKHQIV